MRTKLYQLNKNLKALYISFLIVLSIGVTMGMVYIYLTTSMSVQGTETRYAGDSEPEDFDPDIDVLENPPKSALELVSHAHSHIVSFSFIDRFDQQELADHWNVSTLPNTQSYSFQMTGDRLIISSIQAQSPTGASGAGSIRW